MKHPSHIYYGLDSSALQNFKGMHDRVRDGKVKFIQWPRTRKGYIAFCKHIGKKPKDGQKWSVGRKNHNKGYVRGNVRWELYKFNSVKRKGTRHENSRRAVVKLNPGPKFRKGSKEAYAQIIAASKKRWRDPLQHQRMSRRMKGNTHARRAL